MALSMLSETDFGKFATDFRPIVGKKSDHVYGVVKQAILFRHFPPGAQLLEQSMAGQFACSQSTVREALLRLDEDGLVKRSGYRGTRVTDTSLPEAVEMVRVRLSIERGVARRLALGGANHDLRELEALTAQMDDSHGIDDLYRSSELDRAFHSRLAQASGMSLLSPLLVRCALHIHRFTLGGVEVPRDFYNEAGVGEEHRALLAEVTGGDPVRAEKAIIGHLRRVLERWSPSLIEAVGLEAFRFSR